MCIPKGARHTLLALLATMPIAARCSSSALLCLAIISPPPPAVPNDHKQSVRTHNPRLVNVSAGSQWIGTRLPEYRTDNVPTHSFSKVVPTQGCWRPVVRVMSASLSTGPPTQPWLWASETCPMISPTDQPSQVGI